MLGIEGSLVKQCMGKRMGESIWKIEWGLRNDDVGQRMLVWVLGGV